MLLSEQIKLGRKQLGMSQTDLADAIWVSRNTVSNWECGGTTPDVQSLVLMGALFGVTLDELVKGDEQVMAQALQRDRNHILIAAKSSMPQDVPVNSDPLAATLNLFSIRSTGAPAYARYDNTDVTDAHGLAYRLVHVATVFSRGFYHVVDEHGCRVGTITRKHALQHPVFHVRMDGFERVQVRRETRIDNGYKDIIRFDGANVGVAGNLMGDNFSFSQHDKTIANVHVRPALNRVAYGIEVVDDASAPLALGLTFAALMLRDYDRVWVRGAGKTPV